MTREARHARREPRRAVVGRAMAHTSLRRALVAYLLFHPPGWAAWVGLPVWASDRGGLRAAGVLALLELVPATPLAIALARLSPRPPTSRALWIGYATQSTAYVATGAALMSSAPYAVVAALAAVAAVAVTATRPVHMALLPALSETTGELTAANTATGVVEAVAAALGPLLSALLIILWGAGGVLLVLGGFMAVAGVLAARLTSGAPAPPTPAPRVTDRAGIRLVLGDRTARALTAMVAAEYVLVGMLDILLVVLAIDVLSTDDSGPGLLNAALGVGGVLGAGLTVLLVGRGRLAVPLLVSALVTGLPIALAGATSAFAVALALLLVAGAGKLFVDVTSRTLVQRALAQRMLLAVFGVQEATMMAGLAAGSLAAPLLVVSVGPRWAFAVAGLFLPTVALASWPALRHADAAADVPVATFQLLRRVPFLAVLPPRIVERLALEAGSATLPSGGGVRPRGAAGDPFFLLVQGSGEGAPGGPAP